MTVDDREARVRYAGKLCLHCTRNLAFHHALGRRIRFTDRAWEHRHPFWVNTVNNCLDIAVLEWCKLFGRWSEKHHWRNIVSPHRQDQFEVGLLTSMRMTALEFREARNNMLEYRDQFIAHLDTRPSIDLPHTRFVLRGTVRLYQELMADPANADCLDDWPSSGAAYYRGLYRQAQQEFQLRFQFSPQLAVSLRP